MKSLRAILILFLALHLLPGMAQTPQGLGRNIRAVASTPQGLVAITDDAEVLFSTDQWVTHTTLFNLRAAEDDDLLNLYAIAARGSRVVVGGDDGLLYTADISVDPEAWIPANSPALIGDIRSIASRSDQDTWMAASQDQILRASGNNAQNWVEVSGDASGLQGIAWVGGDTWLAVGAWGIWESINNGLNWNEMSTAGGFTAISSDQSGTALIVGEIGTIYQYSNGTLTEVQEAGLGADYRSVTYAGSGNWIVGGVERTLEVLIFDPQNQPVFTALIDFEEASEDEANGLFLENGTLYVAGIETVPAPEILAQNDPDNPVTVTLQQQSAGDTILYTTDGSDPRTGGTEYSAPFTVTGTVTVQAVAERDGVFSPVVSQEIIAGEDLEPFSIESITVSGTTVTLTQDVSTTGYTYGLEYTTDLGATPQVWTSETEPDTTPIKQLGTGDPLTWEITPVPASPRFWRIVIVPNTP